MIRKIIIDFGHETLMTEDIIYIDGSSFIAKGKVAGANGEDIDVELSFTVNYPNRLQEENKKNNKKKKKGVLNKLSDLL
ncbi:MAG: hypothetical protein ACOCQR_00280 [bacterium]